jgi:N6-L-threonylcarbamoyladenine synthase
MILGVESSCDESAFALFDPERGLRGEWIHSQIARHQPYGGIVPDIASREHLDHFPRLLDEVVASGRLGEVREIAVTAGPGLAGSLALGMSLSMALGVALEVPVYGVNHLRGHAFSPFLDLHARDPASFPANFAARLPHLGLIVSGGNTVLFSLEEGPRVRVLAETVDDAAGEALDKGAKLLGMPYPGGPELERRARGGNAAAFPFPQAFRSRDEKRFSFSGLKTSLRYRLEKMDDAELAAVLPDLCASYQEAVVAALLRKTGQFLETGRWRSLGLSGGVANNGRLRDGFSRLGARRGLPVDIARPGHTGDNAAMIAFTRFMDPLHCRKEPLTFDPSWEVA